MTDSFHAAALAGLLRTDPQFVAALQAAGLGNTGAAVLPKVIEGNRPFDSLGQEHYPCWVMDDGDSRGAGYGNEGGDMAGLVLGSHQQDWQDDIELALVWHQQKFETALAQRRAVKRALVRLLLRHPDLGADAAMAYVVEILSDRSFRHPTHAMAFRIRVHSTIERDGP